MQSSSGDKPHSTTPFRNLLTHWYSCVWQSLRFPSTMYKCAETEKIYYYFHFNIYLQLKKGNYPRNCKTLVTLKTFHLVLFPSRWMYIDISFIYLTKIALVVLFHPWCAKSKKPIKLVHCCESLKLIRGQTYLGNCSEPTTDSYTGFANVSYYAQFFHDPPWGPLKCFDTTRVKRTVPKQ